MNLESLLRDRLTAGFAAAAGEPAAGGPVEPAIRRSQHADFQADGSLALARRLGRNPRDIAAEVVGRTPLDDFCSKVEVSGPGFINLTIRDEVLSRSCAEIARDDRLGVTTAEPVETIVVDYSAPNVVKEMHVGHLRSTVIGDAAVRLLEWLGHRIHRANHLGDWGTPFGMMIEHLLDIGGSEAAKELSVGDLDTFYRAARAAFDADDDFADRSRRRVVALQSGDEGTLRLWRQLVDESEKHFVAIYDRLGVRLTTEDFVGESFYNGMLQSVVEELDRLGLLRDSQGAQCVFPPGFTDRDGRPLPVIVRKRDGGFGYGATDLAAIRYRTQALGATRLLYVVGTPQRQHLQMVFEVARQAGWLEPPARAEHIGFGSVLGRNGKMLRSRAGAPVKLADLLDEAVARAAAVVAEKNPNLDEQVRAQVAHGVGTGAVKYADLSTDRVRDYVFDYDRMLSFEGNTAPYLQYAHARVRSIFGRAGVEPSRDEQTLIVTEPAERALALALLGFEGTVTEVARSMEFHRFASYLHGLASAFTTFYEQCPVVRADEPVRSSRLLLCDLTGRTLALGLGLLGIEAPDQM